MTVHRLQPRARATAYPAHNPAATPPTRAGWSAS
jgi:hypothetical protein